MHHLHPRSRSTSTLFTTTLAVSFLVVALPHVLPCPVDRRKFADTIDGPPAPRTRTRRKRHEPEEDPDLVQQVPTSAISSDGTVREVADSIDSHTMATSRPPRECPVPKPGGVLGQVMGYLGMNETPQEGQERGRVMEVVVKDLKRGKRGSGVEKGEEGG